MRQPDAQPTREPMKRRDFLRTSATGAAAIAVTSSVPAAALAAPDDVPAAAPAAAPDSALPPYVGAGSTAPIRPFQLYDVELGNSSLFAEKRNRMKNFLRNYDERRYLVLYNRVAGRPNPPGVSVPGGWEDGGLLSGHWSGHYMTALAQAHVDQDEQVYKDKLDWMIQEIGACQDALAGQTVHPGYVGALPEDVVLRLGPPRFAVYGGNLNTNTWAPWYTQHKIMRGLLDAYYLTGSSQARDVVMKMGSWAHLAITLGDINNPNYPGPLTRDNLNYMWDTYIAGEFGGVNEVFPELYALTGDEKFLTTAMQFDNRESLFGACLENRDIIVTTNATRPGRRRPNRLHANQHIPQFTGYMRIYEQTGNEDYHTVARNFWDMIVPHRMFAHGGTSGNFPGSNNNIEQLQNRDNIANALASGGAETCTTYNISKLARNLFLHDPDPKYIDYYERAQLNQILGSRADNDTLTNPQVTYFQPLNPGARKSYGNTGTCCGGTGLENHTKYQETVYFRSVDNNTLWVNLYTASTLNWHEKGFTVTQTTDYPREQGTTLTIDGEGVLEIKLRVPAWVRKGFQVEINGQQERNSGRPGSYLSLNRYWRSGDTIKISMPFSVRVERAIDRPDTQSLFYGPLLLPILGDPGQGSYRELTLYKDLKLDGDYSRALTATDTNTFTVNGWTLRPQYAGDTQQQSPYFRRVEPEVVFGSVATGVPNAKRDDDLPNYDVPVTGIVSPGDDGLTFLDAVWDNAPFENHGEFVSTVETVSQQWLMLGLLTADQRATITQAAKNAAASLKP
jgi:DUF1680 family protein